MRGPSLTVGIEEEYQIIDPVTRDLTPGFDSLMQSDHAVLAEVKAELHQFPDGGAHFGANLHLTLMQFSFDLGKHRMIALHQRIETRRQIARHGIDDLVFLFDSDGQTGTTHLRLLLRWGRSHWGGVRRR